MIFSHFQTRPLAQKNAPKIMRISPDLGLTKMEIEKTAVGWLLPSDEILTFSQIDSINADTNSCFLLDNGQLQKVQTYSTYTNRYYSLMPTEKAPTMLISGIPMHRIKDTTPDADTQRKIQALKKPFGRVLDTATGLGYTAIQAAQTAQMVVTIELDAAVIAICKANPWSQGLFTNPKIHPLLGDSFNLVNIFEDGFFNAIIHDPPTLSLAGLLYSQELYLRFYRILKNNGRLFHYVGNPDSRSGASVGRGVVQRLRKAGFKTTPKSRAFGILAQK